MQARTHAINRMPVRTWRWLKVNDAELMLTDPVGPFDRVVTALRPSQYITVSREPVTLKDSDDGTGDLAPALARAHMEEQANWRCSLTIAAGHREQEPIVLDFQLDEDHPTLVDDLVIEAEAGAAATVIVRYTGPAGEGHHTGRTRLIARAGASLTLIKAQLLGGGAAHNDMIGGVAEEGAELKIITAELGAGTPLSGCNLVLAGRGSRASLDVLYLGSGQRALDLTCRAEHRGRESESDIQAHGVLLGRSRKVLRDTLDFLPGAAGSRGREQEQVLLLSPEVRNLSVPVLLCGEEDVEGEHAASSGRPDDGELFYLMTRGLTEADAKKLLAQAAFAGVVERIPDLATQEAILNAVQTAVGGDGYE